MSFKIIQGQEKKIRMKLNMKCMKTSCLTVIPYIVTFSIFLDALFCQKTSKQYAVSRGFSTKAKIVANPLNSENFHIT